MQTWAFPARLVSFAEDDHMMTFRDLPDATCGTLTVVETRRIAAEVLEEAILARLFNGEPIPSPSAIEDGEELVILDPVTAARAALAQAMAAERLTNVALAIKLGKSEGAVRRLISGRRGVKLDTVLQALAITGRKGALTTL